MISENDIQGKQGYLEHRIQDDGFLLWGDRVWVNGGTIRLHVSYYEGLNFSCMLCIYG